MLGIYEYAHDSISHVELSYLVATSQPFASDWEDQEACARTFPKVAEVDSLEAAREWITAATPSEMGRLTSGKYSVREQPHSQAVLCVTAESDAYDE